jgi:hypothetical protein
MATDEMCPQPQLLDTYFRHYIQQWDLLLYSADVTSITDVCSHHAGVLNANEL